MKTKRLIAGRFPAVATMLLGAATLHAQTATFHNAPVSATQMTNPVEGDAAVRAGQVLYGRDCALCHGKEAKGTDKGPTLRSQSTGMASPGELFWYITVGEPEHGMPAWSVLSTRQRWEVVTYLKSLAARTMDVPPAQTVASSKFQGPAQTLPFTDFRYESPGTVRKITVNDLPQPYQTRSSDNSPDLVPRPANAWPKVPEGFKVAEYATGLNNPRLMRTAPNGDVFLAESHAGRIRVFRGITPEGKAEQTQVFASGLKQPYGIAFYPPGPQPEWIYIGNTNSIVRFAYRNGDLRASGPPQHIADLPAGNGHWTRDIQFSADGRKMFVGVGSASNDDDPDTHRSEKNRADILEFSPDGSGMKIYAYGIRNPGGGLAVSPTTGDLWCSVNERDELGDNLVPDYITRVQEGGFYGWPWWYIGGHQDPRQSGKHPELRDKAIVPDVLLQPHNASLEITFYQGKQFPAEYDGDIFASEHGSWNKAVRAGYEVIRVPMHQTGRASGEYQDFLTGFVLDDGNVWGRPVGITVAADGSLLVSDDGSNSIWRISYLGR